MGLAEGETDEKNRRAQKKTHTKKGVALIKEPSVE